MKNYFVNNGSLSETWNKNQVFDLKKDVAASFDISLSKHKDSENKPAFTVLNLTDIHYSHDRKDLSASLSMINAAIQRINPDLLTLTGDQISFHEDKEEYLSKLCAFLDSFDIPWAPILGNHEGFTAEDRDDIGNFYLERGYKNIIFRKNDPSLGVGNYIINLTDGKKIVHSIFMVDSHTDKDYPDGETDYDCIWEPQFDWYKWATSGLTKENGSPVPSSCFLHMPPAEYEYAWQGYKRGLLVGINANNEIVCCPKHRDKNGPYNNGFFDHIKACGTKLVLCGHDHTNTADIYYKDVLLAYSLCTRRNRPCNGHKPCATAVVFHPSGDFTLHNYYETRNGIKEIQNIGRFYSFLHKIVSK